jgi:hypothetical protein
VRAEVATETLPASRRRAGQTRRFAPVWGGVGCMCLTLVAWLSSKLDGRTPLFIPSLPEGHL